jgi:tRNA G37 N-methylase TrmD
MNTPYVKKFDKNGTCVNKLKKNDVYTTGPSERKLNRNSEPSKKNRIVILGNGRYDTIIQRVFNKKQDKWITIEHTVTKTERTN